VANRWSLAALSLNRLQNNFIFSACPLLGSTAPPIVKADELLRQPLQVGDDEAEAGEELTGRPRKIDRRSAELAS
jgi:hypothetical protein